MIIWNTSRITILQWQLLVINAFMSIDMMMTNPPWYWSDISCISMVTISYVRVHVHRHEDSRSFFKIADTIQNEECKLYDIFKSKSHLPSPNSTAISSWYTYDFFVCHSHEDDDWVDGMLVPQLESTFLENDIVMKGNSHSRHSTNIMVPQVESTFLEDDILSWKVIHTVDFPQI